MSCELDDEAWCDIVPMDSGHILLGRSWLYDYDMDHRTKPNTCSFYGGTKKYTLHPKEEVKEEAASSTTSNKVNGFLSAETLKLKAEN